MPLRQFYIFIVCFCFCQIMNAQKNITAILQEIESSSDWVFNYDPEALAAYTFEESLQKGAIKHQLQQIFYRTPFDFEINGESILIFLETPQTFRLCGTIQDIESKVGLPLANIYNSKQQNGTQTGENGYFETEIIAYKNELMTISYIGYKSQTLMVQEFDQQDCKTFSLQIDGDLFGEEIIVKEYILPEITEGKTFSGVHIDFQKLAQRQTIIEQDILKTVQLIPGVTSIDESATNLQIRGGTPDQNLVLWENVTLYDPGHLFGMVSAINPYVVKEVKVFKGAFDPRYDSRIGGIVDLSLSNTIDNQFHGGIGSNLTEAHTYIQAPIVKNKLSVLLSGRNSINKFYNSPTLQSYSTKVFQGSKVEDQKEDVAEGDVDANQQLDFYDINAKVIFQPTDKLTLKASWVKNTKYIQLSSGNI